VTGRGGGAAIGAVVGATTGALIASEAQRNRRGYYAWRQGCYVQRPDGDWIRVSQRYCY
jgi:outer membrane lipoprotein SlyB